MDKKSLVIVIILGVILIGVVAAAFLYDGVINSTILEVNGHKYSQEDFESYLKVWQYESGTEPVDKKTIYENFAAYKLYSQYVDRYHVELPSGEKVTEPNETELAKLNADYNLSKDEYMRVKTEIATVDYLFENLADYWKVSDEEYEEHKAGNEDLFKMYDYRVMEVPVKEPEVESGDISGDTTENSDDKEEASGDAEAEKQARKNEAKSRAVEALAKVQSGDSFEEVAKEYGTMRIVPANGGYSIVNGTVESVSGLYMQDTIWDENIIESLQTLKKGEYSEIYENENSYMFVYLENIREGLDKYDDNTFRRQIANEHIHGEAVKIENQFFLRNINLEKLIPALTKASGDVIEDAHDHENEESDVNISGDTTINNISGDTVAVTSGEIVE